MSDFKIGTVTALFPAVYTAKIKFDGEDVASEKQYSYLSSYAPVVNDKVLLASVAGTYVILGKIGYNAYPASKVGNLVIGGTIGFFGGTPASKDAVGDPSSITTSETADSTYSATEQSMLNHLKTDVTNLYNKLKELIDVLQSYNFV